MRDIPIIETTEQIMFYDTDAAGVVHNIAYLRFIEKNRTILGSEIGLDYKEMSGQQTYGAVVRTEIDYKSPGFLGDDIVIRGWLAEISKVRFWCEFEVNRISDQKNLVKSRQQLALVKMPEGKPIRLPDHWENYFKDGEN